MGPLEEAEALAAGPEEDALAAGPEEDALPTGFVTGAPAVEVLAAEALTDELVQRALAGNRRAVSRCITLTEDGGAPGREVLRAMRQALQGPPGPQNLPGAPEQLEQLEQLDSQGPLILPGAGGKAALRIGFTGPPGSGKSTLVSRLSALFAEKGRKVGVLAVDPSSPFTGGAILGDRVRMETAPQNDNVFFRSMGSRGAVGGLSEAIDGAALVLEACGFDPILIETVGVGQAEIEIIRHADIVIVVAVPGLGDDIQSIKAGIMEIGDLFVVNKCDLPGADRTAHELEAELHKAVPQVSAADGTGISELAAQIEEMAAVLPEEGARGRFAKGETRMDCKKIDHIGIAVKSIEERLGFYESTLGLHLEGVETVEEQKVKTAFLPCGDSELELLESTADDGAVARFIEKNGEGVQHIALRVEDIDKALEELKEKGVRLIDETPRIGAGGARIAFVHPKATGGVLLELCERN